MKAGFKLFTLPHVIFTLLLALSAIAGCGGDGGSGDDLRKYVLSFDANGGEGEMENQVADEGTEITLAENAFTRDGYDFNGWNTAKDGKGSDYADKATLELTEDMTFYAQWKKTDTPTNPEDSSRSEIKISYTVKFDANGGEGTVPKSIEAKSGEEITLPKAELTRTGYDFKGWNTEKDGKGKDYADSSKVKDLATKDGATVTLYAKWVLAGNWSISYVLNGDEVNPAKNAELNPAEYNVETEKVTLADPTRNLYEFAGWYDNAEFSGEKLSGWKAGERTGDITLYAKWEITQASVSAAIKAGATEIKLGGEISAEELKAIAAAIEENPDAMVNLDLGATVGITEIPNAVFLNCANLEKITLPETTTSIGEQALQSCKKLTTVTIPKSVTSIGEEAFYYCDALQTVNYGGTMVEWNALKDKIGENNDALLNAKIICTDGTIVATSVANAASAIGELPEGTYTVTVSGEITDSDLTAIKDAIKTNPNGAKVILDLGGTTGLTYISDGAFEYCTNLVGIVIPEGVVEIWNEAFLECIGLKFIHFPKTLEQLPPPGGEHDSGFEGCDSIAKVSFGGTMEQFSKLMDLEYNTELFNAEMTFGDGSKWTLGKEIHDSPEEVPNISISGEWDDVKGKMIYGSIYNQKVRLDLSGVTGLEKVTYGMFGYKLVGIVLPQGVTSIGYTAFMNCSSLESVTIPESVTSIGSAAFSGASSLKSLVIPEGVLTIETCVFQNCKALRTVVIPASVTSIGAYAFQEAGLETVNFAGSEEDWNRISIGIDNDPLTGATINYNYTSE